MRIAVALWVLCACGLARADDLAKSFPAGSGATYHLTTSEGSAELTISIAASSRDSVVVEYYFAHPGLLASEMWQQYVITVPGSGPPVVVAGYMLTKEARAPERIPAELLAGFDGLSVSDFLLADRAQLERERTGEERLVVPAARGGISATRYLHTAGAQTLAFWLSDAARPIGLVKLQSRGSKAAQNYQLELVSLLTHVGRKIDPDKAVALSAEGRALLGTPLR